MVKVANCLNCGAEFRPKFKRGAYTRHCSHSCGYVTRAREARTDWRERFWAKVAKASPDECWNWTAATTGFGYGVFAMTGSADLHGAHRVSWLIQTGDWPTDCILHKCDNPKCVNPSHLREGSRPENMVDKVAKGRQPRGQDAGTSKLSSAQVLSVFYDQRAQSKIAAGLGVNQSTVSDIKNGRTWRHLTSNLTPRP